MTKSVDQHEVAPTRDRGSMLSWPREALVNAAIDALRTARKSNRPFDAFKLPIELQFECACRSIIDMEGDRAIFKSLSKEITRSKVSDRAFSAWMFAVRRSYWKLNQKRAASVCQFADMIQNSSGSLLDENQIVSILLSNQLKKTLCNKELMDGFDAKDMHVIARLAEQLNSAARLQSDAELHQAQIAKLNAAIRKLESANFDPNKGGDPSRALREFLAMVNREDMAALLDKGEAA